MLHVARWEIGSIGCVLDTPRLAFLRARSRKMSRLLKVARSNTHEMPKLGLTRRIDGNSAEEAELADEKPRRLQALERAVAGCTTPSPDNPESSSAAPARADVDDKLGFSAGNDESAKNLAAVFDPGSDAGFLENLRQAASPLQATANTPINWDAAYKERNR